jgi:hypothetical protein
MMLKRILVPLVIVSMAGCGRQPVDVVPVGESFLPLAVGNRWVYQAEGFDATTMPSSARRDTVSITAKSVAQGGDFFKLEATWPGFEDDGLWVYRAANGNIFVAKTPHVGGSAFLIFDAEVGQRWPVGDQLHGCLSSLALLDDYAAVSTPAGRFDGAKEIGGGWIDCTDFGWTADFARGIGPVRWEAITIAGPTNWLLIEAQIHDENLVAEDGE